MSRKCECPHLEFFELQLSLPELCKLKQGQPCSRCNTSGQNLWICLYKRCLHTGCSEQYNDHSTKHFQLNQNHCVHMNLSSQRIWCYVCEQEVFLTQNRRSSMISNDSSDASRYSEKQMIYERSGGFRGRGGGDSSDEFSHNDDYDDRRFENGLIGLDNIENTCYMNAALQALSNTPSLTGYFLDCGDMIDALTQHQSSQRKTGLASTYHQLVKKMWLRNNGYGVPRDLLYSILNGIRHVYPMFGGLQQHQQQHDTQEFLRCFMDQLHEELKELTPPPPPNLFLKNNYNNNNIELANDNDDDRVSQCSSQSEAEYETCDSGVSEQSSLSEEMAMPPTCSTKYEQHYSRSPSPTTKTNQRLKSINQPTTTTTTEPRNNRSISSSSLDSKKDIPIAAAAAATSTMTTDTTQKTAATIKPVSRSIISDIFDGKLLSSVQCLTCDRISSREETFQDLSLPIPGKDHLTVLHQSQSNLLATPTTTQTMSSTASSGITCTDAVAIDDGWLRWLWNFFKSLLYGPTVSLHDCMTAFFSADELKGDNMYSCEKCKKLRNGIKFSRVMELPEMLCVHLKRFRHDLSYSSKIASPVQFPLKGLDMSGFVHKDCKSEVSKYDLTAVICHQGTVIFGHYISYAKHHLNGQWYEFNDKLVRPVSEETVANCEAYVLFYRKNNPKMFEIRSNALRLLDTPHTDLRYFISKQWFNKFQTFAEPGPIDNWSMLCAHGQLQPLKIPHFIALPQAVWSYLYKQFGGGPVCNYLYECDICHRQLSERKTFQRYKYEATATIYAISYMWFRKWQRFVGGESDMPPGKITNDNILETTENGRCIRFGADYVEVNSTIWQFFHDIYDGGPAIILNDSGDEIIECSTLPPTPSTLPQPPATVSPQLGKIEKIDEVQYNDTSKNAVEKNTAVPPNVLPASNLPSPPPCEHSAPKSQQPPPQPTSFYQKTHKNVSFEDEELANVVNGSANNGNFGECSDMIGINNIDNQSDNSSSITSEIVANGVPNNKRAAKHHNNHHASKTNSSHQISSKKEKRHRGGIVSNGLFGPEGKYSDFKQSNTNSDIPNSYNKQANAGSETSKNDELTSIELIENPSANIEKNGPATNEFNSQNQRDHHHRHHNNINGNKSVIRKKVKSKSGRKKANSYTISHHGNGGGGGDGASDSDK